MPQAKVSRKGQITLPIAARRALGIKPRDKITLEIRDKELVIRKYPRFLDLKGSVKGVRRYSLEEEKQAMMAVAARHVLGKNRGRLRMKTAFVEATVFTGICG